MTEKKSKTVIIIPMVIMAVLIDDLAEWFVTVRILIRLPVTALDSLDTCLMKWS